MRYLTFIFRHFASVTLFKLSLIVLMLLSTSFVFDSAASEAKNQVKLNPVETSYTPQLALSAQAKPGAPKPPTATPPLSTSDGNWVWQNPLPSGDGLYGIDCPTINMCYAVGGSSILMTKDGGQNWLSQSSPANAITLIGIDCPNTTTCFAVSSGFHNGIIVAFNGIDWTTQPAPIDSQLYSISCPSAIRCFASGDGGNGILGYDGTSWTYQSTPATGRIEGVSCPALDTCFAVGGSTILAYNGSTWTSQTSPTGAYLTSISCPTTTTCFALGTNHTIIAYSSGNWTVQFIGAYGNFYGSRISCPTTTKCVAFDTNGGVMIFNGTSWDAQSAVTNTGFQGISCPSVSSCLTVGVLGGIWHYDGSNWSSPSLLSTNIGFSSISCPTPIDCFAISGNGNGILAIYNNGNWTKQTLPTSSTLVDISCASLTFCGVVGDAGTIIMYNGSTWNVLNYPTPYTINSISCPIATNVCFAATLDNIILAYNGSTWTQAYTGSNSFRTISCPLPSSCFGVGRNGAIIKYDGANWTMQASGVTADLSSISCTSSISCFATTSTLPIIPIEDNFILHYDGNSWSKQTSPTPSQPFYDISCVSATICFALSSNILIYENNTWNIQTPVSVGTISCPSITICFAAGGSGRILAKALLVNLAMPDNGAGTTANTFSYALKNVVHSQTINFKLPAGTTINVTGKLPDVPAGININGGTCNAGPTVTLNWQGTAPGVTGLVLSGEDRIFGLKVTHFSGKQIKTNGTGNNLACVVTSS